MSESQRLVLEWKDQLGRMGWPEDAVKRIVGDLCEAGYRQAIEDMKERASRTDRVIQKEAAN